MPCLRGLDISITIQPDGRKLPEFPRPNAPSSRLALRRNKIHGRTQLQSIISDPSSSEVDGINTQISVYVPSIAAAQFFIHYKIRDPLEKPAYFFFKAYMNGWNIASWGVDPSRETSGSFSRALYEPCDRWHYKQDGVVLKREGIESRSFYFTAGPEAAVAAEDGGLIELRAYRAKSRRRKAPSLALHRNQEHYGIISPLGGVLENPEEAAFYDWILVDGLDSPYASFCFHYRSWVYLEQLNLVPEELQSCDFGCHLFKDPTQQRQILFELPAVDAGSNGHGGCHGDFKRRATEGRDDDNLDISTAFHIVTRASDSEEEAKSSANNPKGAFSSKLVTRGCFRTLDSDVVPRRLSLEWGPPSFARPLSAHDDEEAAEVDAIEHTMAVETLTSDDATEPIFGRRPLPPLPIRSPLLLGAESPLPLARSLNTSGEE